MSFFLQNTLFADNPCGSCDKGATSLSLTVRSGLLGPPVRSLQYPSTLDQLRCATYFKIEDTIYRVQANIKQPKPGEGWRSVDDEVIWFHSAWAANFAKYLELLRECGHISAWQYQPETFPIKGIRGGYTPDFKMTGNDGARFWVEIKDISNDLKLWLKTVCFEALYPEESLHSADLNWFRENIEMLKNHIQDWEDCW